MFDFVCPHCGVHATFTIQSEYRRLGKGEPEWLAPKKTYHAYILQCDKCHEIVYRHEDARGFDIYPKRTPKMDKSIPTEVAKDYIEAMKCFDVSAVRASVVMCRRALQSSVLGKGATKDRLADQIEELYNKGIITGSIKDWAHEIRLTGNVGAHPDRDGLKDVTPEEAKELLDFVEEYVNYVYTMPSRVKAKRKRKTNDS